MGQAYIPSMDMIRNFFVQNLFQISSKIPEMLQRNKPKAAEGWQMGDPFRFLFLWRIKLQFLLDSLPSVFLSVLL